MSDVYHNLVQRLVDLKNHKDLGALACLRMGLGKAPGEAPAMLPIVAPFLGENAHADSAYTRALFLTAALFASHPEHKNNQTSLGGALHHAVAAGKLNGDALDKRLSQVLDAHPEDVDKYLRTLISLCASAGQSLDWALFMKDAHGLLSDNENWRTSIRLRWASDFWAGPRKASDSVESPDNNSTSKDNE